MTITLSALQKQRRDTAANWTAENPTLLAGEIGIESDTGYWKVGDGSTAWTSLAYISGLGAEIPVSRLADGIAGQIIQTDTAGTGVEWSSTANLPLGSASAPAYRFQGDTNTGIYSPGADQVAISTNGVGRLFIDASGNVGIGAIPTNYAGYVNFVNSGSSGATYEQRIAGVLTGSLTTDSQVTLKSVTSIPLVFATANTERMRLDSSGRLGLGTSAPSGLFHCNSGTAANNVYITTATSAGYDAVLHLNAGTATGETILNLGFGGDTDYAQIKRGSDNSLRFTNNNAERLRIDSSGRVGIGTTTPNAKFEITNGHIRLSDQYRIGVGGTGDTPDQTTVKFSSDNLGFFTGNTERARIDSSGRLLVGTSSARGNFDNNSGNISIPTFQVENASGIGEIGSFVRNRNDIYGPVVVIGKTRGTSVGSNTLVSSGDVLGRLCFGGADGSEIVYAAEINAVVDGTPGANDMPGRLVFSTTADGASSPTERMRITSTGVLQVADAGNIAVGTTTGTKIGTATTQKLGFYNKTPVVQPTAVADATDAASVITQLNALLSRMRDLGLIAT
jgi:hypothetical protein